MYKEEDANEYGSQYSYYGNDDCYNSSDSFCYKKIIVLYKARLRFYTDNTDNSTLNDKKE